MTWPILWIGVYLLGAAFFGGIFLAAAAEIEKQQSTSISAWVIMLLSLFWPLLFAALIGIRTYTRGSRAEGKEPNR
jgi:4-hydroxybenzoate polyprenyltransferase